jgi:hypothetical protein
MPPTPENKGPQGENKIDLDKILLPKKNPPPGSSVDSAQRINAGVLLEQEQQATLAPDVPKKSVEPIAPPPKKEEVSSVAPLQTYKSDIEQLVQQKNISVVSVAAAEAERRAQTQSQQDESREKIRHTVAVIRTVAMVAFGFFLLAGAAVLLTFIFLRPTPKVPIETPTSPFILVDDTQTVAFTPEGFTHATVMSTLSDAQTKSSISLGLIDRFYLAVSSSTPDGNTTYNLINAQQLLSALAPTMPPDLLRTIQPQPYLLGIHSFDGNQAFLILTVDSYQQGFSGMLGWEATMQKDLSPLFNRTPPPHIPEEGAATSTPTTTAQLLNTAFVDRVVENHDARVIQNSNGDILLLWTFLDKNTLVITTNEYTLREIISRLTNAPITPQP